MRDIGQHGGNEPGQSISGRHTPHLDKTKEGKHSLFLHEVRPVGSKGSKKLKG